jgi:hypothetical protein
MVTSRLPHIQHRNLAKSQKICAVIANPAGVLEGSIKLLPHEVQDLAGNLQKSREESEVQNEMVEL